MPNYTPIKISLAQLAEKLDLELKLAENSDPSKIFIESCAPLNLANSSQLSFLSNPKYEKHLSSSKAGVLIISPQLANNCQVNALISEDPYLSFAKAAYLFSNVSPIASGLANSSTIDASAELDKTSHIGPNATISARAKIGKGVRIGANVFVGEGVVIGDNTIIYPNATIYHGVSLGEDVIIHAGVVLGSDGFGLANDNGKWLKIPQLGSVLIYDNVEIGANTTIDRGALGDTVINTGVKIDNLVQIAHNVQIGAHTAIAAKVGIAGSTKIGANCLIGGASGVNGHISICDNTILAGMAMVTKSINTPGMYASGLPAQPQRQWHKDIAYIHRLGNLFKKIKVLEKSKK